MPCYKGENFIEKSIKTVEKEVSLFDLTLRAKSPCLPQAGILTLSKKQNAVKMHIPVCPCPTPACRR